METICPRCKKIGYKFCPNCGERMEEMPFCNWCYEDLWPSEIYCTGCGRTRDEALNTFPPPGKIKQFLTKLFKLFKKKPAQKTAE